MIDLPKQPASTPLVQRSPFLEGSIVLMEGHEFEDGRLRIVVPAATDDATIEAMTAKLEDHNQQVDRMDQLIATVSALTARHDATCHYPRRPCVCSVAFPSILSERRTM